MRSDCTMMEKRVLVRTKHNLSYAGEICESQLTSTGYLVLKPSEKSGVLIMFPKNEIKHIFLPNNKVLEGDDIREFGL